MRFIQLAFQGRNGFLSYLATFLLTVSTLLGFGQIPYSIALWRAGVSGEVLNKIGMEEAIGLLGKNAFLTYQIFPFVLALLVLMGCVRVIHKRPVLSIFTSRKQLDWKRFFVSFGMWGAFMGIMLSITAFFAGTELHWNYDSETFWMLLLISVFLIPLQTTFEEVLFRGFLFQGFGMYFRKGWPTVLFTGLLFGLMHMANPEVQTLGQVVLIYYVVIGIFLSFITLMDDGMELSMGFHAVNNIFGTLILTNNWQVFQTDALWKDMSAPGLGWDILVTLLVCLPVLVITYARLFGWKEWKERLFTKIDAAHPE